MHVAPFFLKIQNLIRGHRGGFLAKEFCIKMQVPPTVTDREMILAGIRRALILRDRYTILFYLRDAGKMEEYAQRATDKLLSVI